jgi:hypothetical protein
VIDAIAGTRSAADLISGSATATVRARARHGGLKGGLQEASVAAIREVEHCAGEGGRLVAEHRFGEPRRRVARARRPALRIARLPFLKRPPRPRPSLFYQRIYSHDSPFALLCAAPSGKR